MSTLDTRGARTVGSGHPDGAGLRPAGRARAGAAAVVLPLLGVAGVITAWWLATRIFEIQAIVLPPPGDVLAAFNRLPEYLLEQALVTLLETLEGFALSVVAGLLIGMAIASSRTFELMTYPLLVALNAVPKVALAPMLVVWLGFGQLPKVVMVFLVCFFPVVLATAAGLTSTPRELAELTRSMDASRGQTFVKVRFPAALPQIFVGLKVAMPLAVIGAVIGEFVGADSGLGFVINQSGSTGEPALAFAAMGLLSIMSIVLFYALVLVERLLLPWVRETTSQR